MSEAQQICEVCHLPLESMHFHDCTFVPDENQTLRDERDRLRANLVNCVARLEAYYGEDYPAVRDAKAALTPAGGQQGEGK